MGENSSRPEALSQPSVGVPRRQHESSCVGVRSTANGLHPTRGTGRNRSDEKDELECTSCTYDLHGRWPRYSIPFLPKAFGGTGFPAENEQLENKVDHVSFREAAQQSGLISGVLTCQP